MVLKTELFLFTTACSWFADVILMMHIIQLEGRKEAAMAVRIKCVMLLAYM